MSERPNRAPCMLWPTRRDLTGCYVQTLPADQIQIAIPVGGGLVQTVRISRSEARLLARRLNECLDATVIR